MRRPSSRSSAMRRSFPAISARDSIRRSSFSTSPTTPGSMARSGLPQTPHTGKTAPGGVLPNLDRVIAVGFEVVRTSYLFTSESVAEGHPDKVCDRISDEIVDMIYREAKKTGMDPWKIRVGCEV